MEFFNIPETLIALVAFMKQLVSDFQVFWMMKDHFVEPVTQMEWEILPFSFASLDPSLYTTSVVSDDH